MKKITTLAAFGIAAVVTTASAEVSPALHGFQFGGHVGYVSGSVDLKSNTTVAGRSAENRHLSTEGISGGVVLGYSILSNKWLAGLEGKVSFTGNDSSSRSSLRAVISEKVKQGTNFVLGVKLGAAVADNALVFIRPGVAWSDWKMDHRYVAAIGANARKSKTLTGFAIAAGADYAVNNNFTLGAEYEFATYGDMKYGMLTPANVNVANVKVSPSTSTFSLVAKYALGGMGK